MFCDFDDKEITDMKLWGGRFEKATDSMVDDFHSSITFDKRLARQDITGSIAHATMLGEAGIIPSEDAAKIVEGLKGILSDVEAGKIEFSLEAELIQKLRQQAAMTGGQSATAFPGAGGARAAEGQAKDLGGNRSGINPAMGGAISKDKALAEMPGSIQAKFATLPTSAQNALLKQHSLGAK